MNKYNGTMLKNPLFCKVMGKEACKNIYEFDLKKNPMGGPGDDTSRADMMLA